MFLSKELYFLDTLIKFIYSFHMHFPCLLVGFLFYKSHNKNIYEIFSSKLKSLVLRIFMWQTLYFLIVDFKNNLALTGLLKIRIIDFIGGLWFLWAVFYYDFYYS